MDFKSRYPKIWGLLIGIASVIIMDAIIFASYSLYKTFSSLLEKNRIVNISSNEPEIIGDEDHIIKNMVSYFKSLPKEERDDISFYVSYYTWSDSFMVRVSYKLTEYKTEFKTYEDLVSFCSEPERYYTQVIKLGKE